MVSLRCKMVVKDELDKLGIGYISIELGTVNLKSEITGELLRLLGKNLQWFGLEVMDDKKAILIERIKNVITEMVHYSDEIPKETYSNYISHKLGYHYTYLSNLFSEVKGITIQQYIIIHKIEKVKELLLYDELSLTQIADLLHYSSVAHLSNQFKKITGLSPTYFKKLRQKRNDNLENM